MTFAREHFERSQQEHRKAEMSGDMHRELTTLTALMHAAEEGYPKRKYAQLVRELRTELNLRPDAHEKAVAASGSARTSAKRPRDAGAGAEAATT